MVLKPGTSHNLLSASLRPRNPGDIVWCESEGLRTRGVNAISLSLRAEGDPCPSSVVRQRYKFSLSLPFCSIEALNELDDAHPHWGQ